MFYTDEVGPVGHVAVHEGDLVRLDGDQPSDYVVMRVQGGRCWVRNLQSGMDTLSSLKLCRRIGHESYFGG